MSILLPDLLARAAARNADAGVLAEDGQLHRWSDVDRAATALASTLVDMGVRPGDRVAVLHPKSVWSFIAVHAIIRSGAIMVPLDPLGPRDSVQSVLEFCKASAIVGAATTIATRAPDFVATTSPLLIVSGDEAEIEPLDHPAERRCTLDEAVASDPATLPAVQPDDVAYIIFTSGSTGEPKGIAHTHRSAMAYVSNAQHAHRLAPSDRVAGTSPLHFDMSTLELYVVPFAGATAVTVTEAQLRFPASLSACLADASVSVIYAVPYQIRQLCQRGDLTNRNLQSLRQLSFGGEQFAPEVLHEIAHQLPPAELLNVYGPAEVNGIVSKAWPPHPDRIDAVPIGCAWPGVDVRVVDEHLTPVSAGDPGELLVQCASQMQGYWERPELNAACFATIDDKRWYRTGDIVTVDPAGDLHFVGRADTRVKVRGVRLELETIETVLSAMAGVDSAVVGVREDDAGLQHVVAWILPDGADAPDLAAVRAWCRDRLPENAVPTELRIVDNLASSRTGKIDRKALRSTLSDPSKG